MSKSGQEKNAGRTKIISGWDVAIRDAKRKIADLEFAILVFRKRKRAGESWPPATQN